VLCDGCGPINDPLWDDAALRDQVKQIARERRRFGYCRTHVLLEREGVHLNLKKLRRI
jgi:putative transposase